MSKPQHPYPLPVRVAVAETIAKQVLVMREWSDLTAQTREAFLKDADQVLHTLWDASRVDTVEQLEALPDEAVINDGYFTQTKDINQWTGGFHQFANNDQIDLPSYVIYWGDSDE